MSELSTTLPRLTIVIPTVSRAYCVGRAIESALAQTYPHIEIIVSDNGSSDGTEEVIARYEDPRLRKFRHEETMPSAVHGNFLLDQARGEFFLGLSDDDFLEPLFAEKVIALFDRYPDLSFAYTGCWIHFGDVRVPCLVGPEVEDGLRFIENHYGGWRNVCWCACVCKVSLMRKIGHLPLDTNIGDMYYWTQLAFMGRVGCVQEIVSNYIFLTTDNATGGVPPPLWAAEEKRFMEGVEARFFDRCANVERRARLQKNLMCYLSITTTLQFVWVALRDKTKAQLLSYLPHVWGIIHFKGGLKYLIAAILLPRPLLRSIVIARARVTAQHNAGVLGCWRRHVWGRNPKLLVELLPQTLDDSA